MKTIAPTASALVQLTVNHHALLHFLEPALALSAKDDIILSIGSSGLEQVTIDPSHVALVKTTMPIEEATHYRAQDATSIAFPARELVRWLKGVPNRSKTSEVTLAIYRREGGSSIAALHGSTNAKWDTTHTESLAVKSVPKVGKEDMVKLDVGLPEFLKAVKGVFAEDANTRLTWTGERLHIAGWKDDENVFNHYMDVLPPRAKDKRTSLFHTQYLRDVVRTIRASRATMYLGDDYPLQVDWSDFGGKGTFLLAPRIET